MAKVDVLRLEVSCGDSGLWFGPIKIKVLLSQVSFKSDIFWENFEIHEKWKNELTSEQLEEMKWNLKEIQHTISNIENKLKK